jgi:hypothetical protein
LRAPSAPAPTMTSRPAGLLWLVRSFFFHYFLVLVQLPLRIQPSQVAGMVGFCLDWWPVRGTMRGLLAESFLTIWFDLFQSGPSGLVSLPSGAGHCARNVPALEYAATWRHHHRITTWRWMQGETRRIPYCTFIIGFRASRSPYWTLSGTVTLPVRPEGLSRSTNQTP